MTSPKNYYLYFYNGKVYKQAINLNSIYPESYAEDKIPSGADIFARIITSDTVNKKWNGYRTNGLKSTWFKCAVWIDYYPEPNTNFENATLYHEAQLKYINKYIPYLSENEKNLLMESTEKIINRVWCDL